MTSLLSGIKQIHSNQGYYIPVGNCTTTVFANIGTDAAPNFNNGTFVSSISTAGASALIASAGAGVFRDMGKTLISSGRTFRKVQLLVSSSDVVVGNVASSSGVGGVSPSYLTGYIILPGSGDGANQSGTGFTPVARLG